MLTYADLVTLEPSLRAGGVLSVYLDGTSTDPAAQRAWRVRLQHALDEIRGRLASAPHAEREKFAACVRALDAELAGLDGAIGAPGWVAFVTPEGVWHAARTPATMPTLAVWRTGAFVTPYLRALKESRPVIVGVVDATHATLYRYRFGAMQQMDAFIAESVDAPPAHMGDAPRMGFHAGTRGVSGRDAAQRARRESMARMLRALARRATALVGEDGWLVLGGIPRVVAHASALMIPLAPRMLQHLSLDVHASPAEIADAARAGASTLRDRWDARQLEEIVAQADARALGVVGPPAARRALSLSCVRSLLLTPRFLAEHGQVAEQAVRRAFDQNASVEDVVRDVADRLDALGGIAASLRYRPGGLARDARAPEVRTASEVVPSSEARSRVPSGTGTTGLASPGQDR